MVTRTPQTDPDVIFINYRRTESGWPADRLAMELQRVFGKDRIFLDAQGIVAGDEFPSVIEENLRRATVLIVLISTGWLHVEDESGSRRLYLDDDWVRREIRTGLARQDCRVIPVLVDDAELPDNKDLPDDIAELVKRQRISIRQAHIDDDVEILCGKLESFGFQRLPGSESPGDQEFCDRKVADVVAALRKLQQDQGTEFVNRRQLLRELNLLFNRKTFRHEALRSCPEQRWGDRLDSAYQTERVLRDWERNVREVAEDEYSTYVELLKEVGSYCMQMGALLFEPAVDYNSIEAHIGKTTFKAQLPDEIRFPGDETRQPLIPDAINDRIEDHRVRAVALMEEFARE